MSKTISGGCHCGAVRYEFTGDPVVGANCHCDNCKRFTGTGHATNLIVPADGFSVTGDLSTYTYTAGSGNQMLRYFCPNCGTPVYGTTQGSPNVVLRAGGMDDPSTFQANVSLFTPQAMPWDHLDENTRHFDGMPPPPPPKD